MTTSTSEQAAAWRGATAFDRDGDKIGKVEEIYIDEQTRQPAWALVNTGFFGGRSSFVPLRGAEADGDNLRVAWDKATVKDAPNVTADQELETEEERALYSHYGFDYDEHGGATDDGHDTSGPDTDDAMTRSEEEMRVGVSRSERGRVRLKKYVVTEEVQQTVPVRREEVRVEREPITDGNVGDAVDGPEISEEEHEVVLREEQPVVETRAVPKERIRLGKETVSDEETVSGEVRKEQIEVEDDDQR